jgi:hypothetical protein
MTLCTNICISAFGARKELHTEKKEYAGKDPKVKNIIHITTR